MPRQRRPKFDALTKEIARRVLQARKDRGVTQVEMARHLGVSQTNVSGYETGRLRLPSDVLAKIAAFLRVSGDELLGTKPVKPVSPTSRKLRQRLEQAEMLSKRDQAALIRVLEGFLARSPVRGYRRATPGREGVAR